MFPYFQLFGRTIGSYGVCMVIGFLLVGWLAIRKCKKLSRPAEDIYIVGACVLLAALVCGSLLYVFVTYPISYIISAVSRGDFSFFGGIVFYGGLIGGIGGALLGVRLARCPWNTLTQAIVPYVPLGHAIGRIGCLLAGCCHGMPYNGPLAVYYPNSVLQLPPDQGYFPVQPLEALLNLGICGCLIYLSKKENGKKVLVPAYLCMYAVVRFTLEFFRGDEHRGIFSGVSLSQWISIGMLAVGVIWTVVTLKMNNHKKTKG